MHIKTKLRALLTVIVLGCSLSLVQAQDDPGDYPELPDDAAVPIDGGLSILIAAGIGYAVKKGYDKRKSNNTGNAEENKN